MRIAQRISKLLTPVRLGRWQTLYEILKVQDTPPTNRTLSVLWGVSLCSVHNDLKAMREAELITWCEGEANTLRLVRHDTDVQKSANDLSVDDLVLITSAVLAINTAFQKAGTSLGLNAALQSQRLYDITSAFIHHEWALLRLLREDDECDSGSVVEALHHYLNEVAKK